MGRHQGQTAGLRPSRQATAAARALQEAVTPRSDFPLAPMRPVLTRGMRLRREFPRNTASSSASVTGKHSTANAKVKQLTSHLRQVARHRIPLARPPTARNMLQPITIIPRRPAASASARSPSGLGVRPTPTRRGSRGLREPLRGNPCLRWAWAGGAGGDGISPRTIRTGHWGFGRRAPRYSALNLFLANSRNVFDGRQIRGYSAHGRWAQGPGFRAFPLTAVRDRMLLHGKIART